MELPTNHLGKLMEDYLTDKEVAAALKLETDTLKRWRWAGKGPKFYKVGGTAVRYKVSDLEAFVQNGESHP